MGIPKSYKDQNGCHNCKHRYDVLYYDPEELPWMYCTFKTTRPLSTIEIRKKTHQGRQTPGIHFDLIEKWAEWAKDHTVEPYGVCDHHKNEKIKN